MRIISLFGSFLAISLLLIPSGMTLGYPDIPDFDDSGVYTTRDASTVDGSTNLVSNTQCIKKWFYDENNVDTQSQIYLMVWGAFYGTQDINQNMGIYINGVEKQTIIAHHYFSNSESQGGFMQWARIPLPGTKSSLGIVAKQWNDIIIMDKGTSTTKENVKIGYDNEYPYTKNMPASEAVVHSYYATSTTLSACTAVSHSTYNNVNREYIIFLQYEAVYSTKTSDDGVPENYMSLDSTDDHIEKKFYLTTADMDYSSWVALDVLGLSAGSGNPPWDYGKMKLSVCSQQHSASYTCPGYQYIMDFQAYNVRYTGNTWYWATIFVPAAAFPVYGSYYYFMIYKTTTNLNKETVYFALSTNENQGTTRCYWNDGSPHGDWTWSTGCPGELIVRLRVLKQVPGYEYRDFAIHYGHDYQSGWDDLPTEGPYDALESFEDNGWYPRGFNVDNVVPPTWDFSENYANGYPIIQNGGDDADFVYINAHGAEGQIIYPNSNAWGIGETEILLGDGGYNSDTEWVLITACQVLKSPGGGAESGAYRWFFYTTIHMVLGWRDDILINSVTPFMDDFLVFVFNDGYTIYDAFLLSENYHMGSSKAKVFYRLSTLNDNLWGEGDGTVSEDPWTKTWDIKIYSEP